MLPSGGDGCPVGGDETKIVVDEAGGRYTIPLHSGGGDEFAHCAVGVHLAHDRLRLDRPFVDALVVRNDAWWPTIFGVDESSSSSRRRRRLCVTIRATIGSGASTSGSCMLSDGGDDESSDRPTMTQSQCLVRLPIPFAWFDVGGGGSGDDESNEQVNDESNRQVKNSQMFRC